MSFAWYKHRANQIWELGFWDGFEVYGVRAKIQKTPNGWAWNAIIDNGRVRVLQGVEDTFDQARAAAEEALAQSRI